MDLKGGTAPNPEGTLPSIAEHERRVSHMTDKHFAYIKPFKGQCWGIQNNITSISRERAKSFPNLLLKTAT